MSKPTTIRLMWRRLVFLAVHTVMLLVLGGGVLGFYGLKQPTWFVCLSVVLVLESLGEVLRGKLPDPFHKFSDEK